MMDTGIFNSAIQNEQISQEIAWKMGAVPICKQEIITLAGKITQCERALSICDSLPGRNPELSNNLFAVPVGGSYCESYMNHSTTDAWKVSIIFNTH